MFSDFKNSSDTVRGAALSSVGSIPGWSKVIAFRIGACYLGKGLPYIHVPNQIRVLISRSSFSTVNICAGRLFTRHPVC